jgi:hypothetical protein
MQRLTYYLRRGLGSEHEFDRKRRVVVDFMMQAVLLKRWFVVQRILENYACYPEVEVVAEVSLVIVV